ncbi:MAG: hypothetical protein ACJAUT_001162 [Cellvibrionaceae bacterium]|jgi:hypothetical protein
MPRSEESLNFLLVAGFCPYVRKIPSLPAVFKYAEKNWILKAIEQTVPIPPFLMLITSK